MANGRIFSDERRKAHQEILFWAERLSRGCAVNYPDWKQNYEEAKRRLQMIKEKEVNRI